MKITHYGHACVLVETGQGAETTRALIDPGGPAYSHGFEDLRDLNAVLITHEHPDHLDVERVIELCKHNPGAEVIANPGAAARLTEAGVAHRTVSPGDQIDLAGCKLQVLGGEHAVIHPKLGCVHNNAYLINGQVLHPGDSFVQPSEQVDVLLVPAGGPWMKVSEAIDYVNAVAPRVAVPIHQAGLAAVHQQLHHQLLTGLAPESSTVQLLEPGIPADL